MGIIEPRRVDHPRYIPTDQPRLVIIEDLGKILRTTHHHLGDVLTYATAWSDLGIIRHGATWRGLVVADSSAVLKERIEAWDVQLAWAAWANAHGIGKLTLETPFVKNVMEWTGDPRGPETTVLVCDAEYFDNYKPTAHPDKRIERTDNIDPTIAAWRDIFGDLQITVESYPQESSSMLNWFGHHGHLSVRTDKHFDGTRVFGEVVIIHAVNDELAATGYYIDRLPESESTEQ